MGKKCKIKLYKNLFKIYSKKKTSIINKRIKCRIWFNRNKKCFNTRFKKYIKFNIFIFYKTFKTKKKNSNFKDLYLRVQKELKEREAPIFKPEPLPVYHPPEKPTSIYEVFIPDFFNDKKSNNNDIWKIINEEEKLKEEIEMLKKEKMDLMCQMINKNNNNGISGNNLINVNIINGNKINEENKDNVKNLEKEKENNDISFYKINDNIYEENIFINPMKYPLDIKLENDKIFQDDNYFLQKY